MGDKDFIKPLLERRGTVYFGKVSWRQLAGGRGLVPAGHVGQVSWRRLLWKASWCQQTRNMHLLASVLAHLSVFAPAPACPSAHLPALLQVKMKPGKPLTFAKVPVPEQNRQALGCLPPACCKPLLSLAAVAAAAPTAASAAFAATATAAARTSSCPALPCPALPCPAMPCHAMPCPVCWRNGSPLTHCLPGPPLATITDRRSLLVFGLPGNPVSSLVTFHLAVVPCLRKMEGWQVRRGLSLCALLGT